MVNKLCLLLLSYAYLVSVVNLQTCKETSAPYLYNSISITCANNTRTIPAYNKTVNTLNCLDCNIPILDDTTILLNFRGESFNMSNSHIRKIKKSAFINFTNNTHSFIFENNEIDYVEPKTFIKFRSIDEIRLRNNKLSILEPKLFDETQVTILDLSRNHINNVSLIFDGLKVTKLNLSANGISNLPENVFDGVTFWKGRQWRYSAQELDLSKNFLEKINPNTFKSVDKDNTLNNLHLTQNSITTIENNTFIQLSFLRLLNLEENKISNLYSNSFNGLTNMQTLILKKNLVTDIPIGLFSGLKYLESLDFSENSITSLKTNTFSGLIGLTKLNISHNQLKTLDDSHMFPLGKLYSLDISDNKLHDFKLEVILEHHFRLRLLVLNNNFWTCKQLVQMYKLLNRRGGGFDYPSRHFDVPNLHGIACSRVELESYDDLSFENFLGIISQDHVFEDVFDSRLHNDSEFQLTEIAGLISNIQSITCMFIVITCVLLILFTYYVAKLVFSYLKSQNILGNGTFSFAYKQSQDNVELLN